MGGSYRGMRSLEEVVCDVVKWWCCRPSMTELKLARQSRLALGKSDGMMTCMTATYGAVVFTRASYLTLSLSCI